MRRRLHQALLGTALLGAALLPPRLEAAVAFVDVVPDKFLTDPHFGESQFDVDFNTDGTVDVRLVVSAISTFGFRAYPAGHAMVQSFPGDPGSHYVMPIFSNQLIGSTPVPTALWVNNPIGSTLSSCVDIGCLGYFVNGLIASIGVQFALADGVHYGWVEIEGLGGNGRIRSYAWETVPGVPIIAGGVPEPGRMALLFTCCFGLISTRRRHR